MHTHVLSRNRLLIAGLALGLAGLIAAIISTQLGGPSTAGAADHRDAPMLTPPGGDVRTDINDVYVFASPSNADRTVLMMTVNGLTKAGTPAYFGRATPGVTANKRMSYYLNVDNDGDATADLSYRINFGKPRGGVQSFEVRRLDEGGGAGTVVIPFGQGKTTKFGADPRVIQRGPVRAFAGMSDDPFFFDLPGFINLGKGLDAVGLDNDPNNNSESFIGCTSPRPDAFEGSNVSTLALELPDAALKGASDSIGVWAHTTNGGQQVDRMGRPAIATVFIPNNPIPPDNAGDSMKSTFNKGVPSDDATFRPEVVNTLETLFSLNNAGGPLGGTDNASDDAMKISGLADILLPDVLTYDVSDSGGFLNGRKLDDDVIDAELGLVTEGLVTTDCVAKSDTFSNQFPHVEAVNR